MSKKSLETRDRIQYFPDQAKYKCGILMEAKWNRIELSVKEEKLEFGDRILVFLSEKIILEFRKFSVETTRLKSAPVCSSS